MESNRKVEEVKYLVTENYERYRKIMNYLFESINNMKYWSYSEEIFSYIKLDDYFKEYTLENLKSDLESLVEWKNIIADTDTKKVRTIDEFKNREFKYQISKTSIEIQRMLEKIATLSLEEGADLNANFIKRFLSLLEKYQKIKTVDNKELYLWWGELKENFVTLNNNYTGFVNKFSSRKIDEIIEVKDFLIYKDKFHDYLREFTRDAKRNHTEIIYLLENILKDKEFILEKIFQYESENIAFQNIAKDDFFALNYDRFSRMEEWFLNKNGKLSLMETLFNNTDEIIKKIIKYALKIAEEIEFGYRKDQYLKIKNLFNNCKNIEEAHILSSQIFGIIGTTHILNIEDRETENINSSVYDEAPINLQLTEGKRGAANKIIKNTMQINYDEKNRKRLEILTTRRKEQEKLENLMKNSDYKLENLPLLTSKERRLILNHLDKKEILSEDLINLKSDDGIFTLPNFKIKMEKN